MIIGTWLFTKMRGELVGTDAEGNRYFQDKRVVPGMRRKRWV
ncbi:MAG: NADH:ubiquinone oxidoreductase subunit NDUFA12, partial [Reyranella sp.]